MWWQPAARGHRAYTDLSAARSGPGIMQCIVCTVCSLEIYVLRERLPSRASAVVVRHTCRCVKLRSTYLMVLATRSNYTTAFLCSTLVIHDHVLAALYTSFQARKRYMCTLIQCGQAWPMLFTEFTTAKSMRCVWCRKSASICFPRKLPLACHQNPSHYNKTYHCITEVLFTGLCGARSGCRWAWWLCRERCRWALRVYFHPRALGKATAERRVGPLEKAAGCHCWRDVLWRLPWSRIRRRILPGKGARQQCAKGGPWGITTGGCHCPWLAGMRVSLSWRGADSVRW